MARRAGLATVIYLLNGQLPVLRIVMAIVIIGALLRSQKRFADLALPLRHHRIVSRKR